MSLTKRLLAFRRADTRRGDSLQAIAAREMGDASKWPDLAAINGLQPPWITNDLGSASATVLLAGQQQIKVPAAAPAPSGTTDRDSVFGTDIALPNGRLVVGATGDLEVITGPDNLSQALTNRLASPTGDLDNHPEYGCEAYKLLGQGGTATTDRLVASMVARAVRSDQRVERIDSAIGSLVGDTLSSRVTAVAVDGRRVSVGIPAGPGTPSSV